MRKFHLFHKLISTSLGCGYMPYAPGTTGALFGLVVWYVLSLIVDYTSLMIITILLIAIFTVIGVWSSGITEEFWGKDPAKVVIDETVGMWIALLAVPAECRWGYIVVAFVLFRFFDMVKPLGIRKLENLKGGLGIMADDCLSGIYSTVIIFIYRFFFE